jgi:hypothetical protein
MIKKAAFIFTFVFIASLCLTAKVNAEIINTLNISIQNPPAPPPPPQKPEPPLPPNVPTLPPSQTPAPTNNPTPQPTGNTTTTTSGGGGDGLGCANNDCSGTSSNPQGQVLGASKMAKTGTFEENLYLAIMTIGGIITFQGLKNIKKAFKVAK